MEKEEISTGTYIRIGEITLVPILRMVAVCLSGRRGVTGFGTREVIGMVVLSPVGNRAISIYGEEVPIEEYTTQLPEIRELLRSK